MIRMGADFTAELLLRFYREPSRFRGEARRRDAPPADNEVILKLALGRRIEFTDPALNEPGTVTALKVAAALYVRHVFFRPDATPYQILGLAPGASGPAIKESFRLLMQLVHPDRQDSRNAWPESFAALANRAYGVLRNQDSRVTYDRDAVARAAVARAVHRAAAAAEASLMPVVVGPARPGGRSPLGRPVLPEWLTAGVGGYVRAHPAVAAFAVLIAGAALVIGMSVREGPEGLLAREVREVLGPATPTIPVTARAAPDPAVLVAGAALVPPRSGSVGVAPLDGQIRAALRVDDAPGGPEGIRAPSGNRIADVAAAPASGIPMGAGSTAAIVPIASQESAVAPSLQVVAAAAQEPIVPASLQVVAETGGSVPRAMAANAPAAATVPRVARVEPVSTEPSIGKIAAAAAPAAPVPQGLADPQLARAAAPTGRAELPATASLPAAQALPPASTEIEALFAEFVEAYERGRLDAFAALFDDDADTNLRHGRAAIRGEYDELFRLSSWRRMQLTRINWRRAGDRAYAQGEIAVRIGWRDGREVEQRVAVEMELVRRDGRAVIARLSHQPKNP
jgi:uncharacterized protein (TIGR02246 family)